MADLLIYNKLHWYDELGDEARVAIDKKYPGKFARRYQKGDIVEVRPDGYYAKHGYNKKSFALVEMAGIKGLEYLSDPQLDGEEIVKRRRYQSDLSRLSLDAGAKAEVAKLADAYISDKTEVVK